MDRDGAALLRAILREPADDFHRHVYADWLEENGQAERAELVRGQIAGDIGAGRFIISQDDSGYYPVWGLFSEPRKTVDMPHVDWIRRAMVGSDYHVQSLPPGMCVGMEVEFARGFVCRASLPLAAWLQHGAALRAAHPLERVEISDREPARVADPSPGDWCWVLHNENHEPDGDEPMPSHFIPCAVWDLLEGYDARPSARIFARRYPTQEAAIDALSDACLALFPLPS